MRWKLVAVVLVAVLLVGGGATLGPMRVSGGAGAVHRVTATARAPPSPSPTGTSSTPAPTPTPTPSASPTATAAPSPTASVAGACIGSQFDTIVGAASSASGGQEGITALIGHDGAAACDLSGTPHAQRFSAGGSPLPTSEGAALTGQAWLAPDRVALGAWIPNQVRSPSSSPGTRGTRGQGSAPAPLRPPLS